MIKLVVFDLDDTLYNEFTYVESGFREVSKYMASKYLVNENSFFTDLIIDVKNNGRGRNFNTVLEKYNLNNKDLVKKLICIYQNHKPKIQLYYNINNIINEIKKMGISTALITDGTMIMQKNKVESLKLAQYMDMIIYTDEYGRENWKPNTYCYKKCLNYFNVNPEEMVYIGDNPEKDFYGANKLGIGTIMIETQKFLGFNYSNEFRAKYSIKKIEEVFELIRLM